MPSVEYVPGVPMWIDLGTSDLEAAHRFYAGLFGWEFQSAGPEAGGYGFYMLRGKMVAGVGPLMQEQQPVAWSTYVCTADADDTVARVRAAGGTVLMEPMDVMGVGRMAFFMDTAGAALGIWQPITHTGAELANEPGAFCWNELATRDIEAAKAFYKAVFDWDGTTNDWGGTTYTEFKVGDRTIGGMREMGPNDPAEVPAHWLVYFAVENTDAVVARASEEGGSVLVPAMDIEPGRFAVFTDPKGAAFAVIQLKEAPVGG